MASFHLQAPVTDAEAMRLILNPSSVRYGQRQLYIKLGGHHIRLLLHTPRDSYPILCTSLIACLILQMGIIQEEEDSKQFVSQS